MTKQLHLSAKHRRILESLLHEHLPDVEVWAYGSRVTGRSHDGSDLDLVLRGPGLKEIPYGQLADFEDAVRESRVPFLVEARDWARLPKRFHREIEREYVVLVGAEEWELRRQDRVPLRDLIDLQLSSVDKKSVPNEKPVRLCNYTDVYYNDAIRRGMPFMEATATEREIARCGLSAGDVVITKDSEQWDDIGVPTFIMDDLPDLVCGYHLAILRPKLERVHGRYLFYALSTHDAKTQFHQFANGITRFGLLKDDIGLVEIPCPKLHKQRAIAHILGTLDDKIELNRRMNKILEEMVQAIFRDWFVDFGPTRTKAEGRAPYLLSELWELFPDTLDDEGNPTGWQTHKLSDLAHHHRATVSPSTHPDCMYEHYSIPAYDVGNKPAIDVGDSIKSNKTIVPQGAVLLSKLNPEIERVWLPNTNAAVPQIASTEFLALTPLAPATSSALYMLFKSPHFRAEMTARVTGTSKSHQRVPAKSILACEVLVATPKLLAMFDRKVSPMMNRLLSNRRESNELAKARDALLPKLMSGEIRLQDAEKIIESAA